MKLFVCIFLPSLLLLQGPPPTPPENSQEEQRIGGSESQDAGADEESTQPLPATINQVEPIGAAEQPPNTANNSQEPSTPNWWVVVFTGVIAFAAIIQLLIHLHQSSVMRQSLKATTQAADAARDNAIALMVSQRAQLIVTTSNTFADFVSGKGKPIRLTLQLINSGTTPAHDFLYDARLELLPPPFDDFTLNAKHVKASGPMTIYGNAPAPTSIPVEFPAPTSDDASKLEKGDKIACLHIRSTYRDVFRADVRTSNYAVTFKRNGNVERLPKYNDSN